MYKRQWQDGVCRVTDHYYTKTIQFQDINYQLAQQEDKTAIFDAVSYTHLDGYKRQPLRDTPAVWLMMKK